MSRDDFIYYILQLRKIGQEFITLDKVLYSDINFSLLNLQNILFKQCTFKNCNFTGCAWGNNSFDRIVFINCKGTEDIQDAVLSDNGVFVNNKDDAHTIKSMSGSQTFFVTKNWKAIQNGIMTTFSERLANEASEDEEQSIPSPTSSDRFSESDGSDSFDLTACEPEEIAEAGHALQFNLNI